MIVIGLAGPMQSGKDAAFEVIQKWASERGVFAVRRGFADALKLSCCRLFIPDATMDEAIEWANNMKFRSNIAFHPSRPRFVKDAEGEWEQENIERVTITGRELLQRYGTEAHRWVFGEDFWVDYLLPIDELARLRAVMRHTNETRYPSLVVITDTRFINEAKRIRHIHGQVWRIVRPSVETGPHEFHVSEASLPSNLVDRVIHNDGTLEEFGAKVIDLCEMRIAPQLRTIYE